MNREAWLMFLGLAVASAVGVLGFTAWKKHQELTDVRAQLAEVRKTAEQKGAHLAETTHALELVRQQAESLAREFSVMTNTQQRLESEMRSALQSRDIAISELQGKLTVNILDRILFDSGEATLKPEGMHLLDQVAKVLSRFASRQVQVFGHTDNVPIRVRFASNWELSTARALSAVRYLTEKAGVDPKRLSAVGCGEFQPIADNATPEGRAKNRRIALVVLPEQFVPTDVDRGAVSTNAVPIEGASTNAVPEAAPTPIPPLPSPRSGPESKASEESAKSLPTGEAGKSEQGPVAKDLPESNETNAVAAPSP